MASEVYGDKPPSGDGVRLVAPDPVSASHAVEQEHGGRAWILRPEDLVAQVAGVCIGHDLLPIRMVRITVFDIKGVFLVCRAPRDALRSHRSHGRVADGEVGHRYQADQHESGGPEVSLEDTVPKNAAAEKDRSVVYKMS